MRVQYNTKNQLWYTGLGATNKGNHNTQIELAHAFGYCTSYKRHVYQQYRYLIGIQTKITNVYL